MVPLTQLSLLVLQPPSKGRFFLFFISQILRKVTKPKKKDPKQKKDPKISKISNSRDNSNEHKMEVPKLNLRKAKEFSMIQVKMSEAAALKEAKKKKEAEEKNKPKESEEIEKYKKIAEA